MNFNVILNPGCFSRPTALSESIGTFVNPAFLSASFKNPM